MLDLVPVTGPWGQVTDAQLQSRFVRQPLQFHLPQADPRSIAAARVGGDEKFGGLREGWLSHAVPPAANGFDGERGGVVIDAHAHPPAIVGHLVHPIRRGAAQFRDHEIMHAHRLRMALGSPFRPLILEVSDQFLLLGVDGNDGLMTRLDMFHLFYDSH